MAQLLVNKQTGGVVGVFPASHEFGRMETLEAFMVPKDDEIPNEADYPDTFQIINSPGTYISDLIHLQYGIIDSDGVQIGEDSYTIDFSSYEDSWDLDTILANVTKVTSIDENYNDNSELNTIIN
jgi:hypothetical protein